MHNRATIVSHTFVQLRSVKLALMQAPFGVLACRSCLALAICDCKDLAWALTQEWALPIHAAKTSTWALTWEWALARDTTVWGGDEIYAVVIIDIFYHTSLERIAP